MPQREGYGYEKKNKKKLKSCIVKYRHRGYPLGPPSASSANHTDAFNGISSGDLSCETGSGVGRWPLATLSSFVVQVHGEYFETRFCSGSPQRRVARMKLCMLLDMYH